MDPKTEEPYARKQDLAIKVILIKQHKIQRNIFQESVS